jgi:hypothetical protein
MPNPFLVKVSKNQTLSELKANSYRWKTNKYTKLVHQKQPLAKRDPKRVQQVGGRPHSKKRIS